MAKLTKRQNEILSLIQSHMSETGSPPTRAEIAKTMGFRSPNAAEDHLRALARKGVIELIPGTSRGIRLIQKAGVPVVKNLNPKNPREILEEHQQGLSRLPRNFFGKAIDVLWKIEGNQFQTLGILNNDYLAIQFTERVANGQLALIRNNAELTLKKISPETLQNANIEGLVLGIIRNLLQSPLQ